MVHSRASIKSCSSSRRLHVLCVGLYMQHIPLPCQKTVDHSIASMHLHSRHAWWDWIFRCILVSLRGLNPCSGWKHESVCTKLKYMQSFYCARILCDRPVYIVCIIISLHAFSIYMYVTCSLVTKFRQVYFLVYVSFFDPLFVRQS